MKYTDKQFIPMPDFTNLKSQNLKYLDALTYVAIRSFDSKDNEYSYPSYDKIKERSGLGTTFIATSINRLEKAGFFKVERSKGEGVCNRYYFSKIEHYEIFSYDVLFRTIDLTNNEKAMLLCLRQFFVHGTLTCIDAVKVFAKQLGLTYSIVYKNFIGLLKKGYIKRINVSHKYSNTNGVYHKLTDKIKWPLPKNTVESVKSISPILKVA